MLQDATALVRAILVPIAALLPIVNPIGSAPIFLSMSADLPAPVRYVLARRVAWYAFLLLTAAMLIGSYVLAFFGISLPIVRVGGGLLVTANGWRLLYADTATTDVKPPATDAWDREVARRAFYPLTFPTTVGPGSVTVAITLGARIPGRGVSAISTLVIDLVAVAIVSLILYLSFRYASRLIGMLGETGTIVFVRMSSFILLCIGVSIIWSGVLGLIEPLLRR